MSSDFPNTRRSKIDLPIDSHKRSILYLLEKHNVLILVGETGCGKSTRLPQILYSAGVYNEPDEKEDGSQKLICVTEPRRIAAMQLAQRVADELNCNLGSLVGYTIRFEDATKTGETLIKFMTEGLLVREMMFDPLLKKYSVIMVDEAHERNLNTDLLIGLLKCLLIKRKDLKLIVCSATMNVNNLVNFFTYDKKLFKDLDERLEKPALFCVQGKSYPIKIFYKAQATPNYLEESIEIAIRIHESYQYRLKSGKILIFLTGQDEVEYVCEKLNDYGQTTSSKLYLQKLLALPLHASLRPEEISRVFEEKGRNLRLCIVSTNVAETSLTIDNIGFVIDCGFAKLKIFDTTTGIDTLLRVPISISSAKQRAGRAGRTRDGVVYRLYPESEYNKLELETTPEIQRTSLTETILMMKSLGITNLLKFPLISPMPRNNLISALELLHALEIINDAGELTQTGSKMALLNLEPKISKTLLFQGLHFCSLEACRIAAMLQVKEIYFKYGKFANDLWSNPNLAKICAPEGDLLTYLNIYNGFLASNRSFKWAEKRNLNYQALQNAIAIAAKLEKRLTRLGVTVNSCNGRVDLIKKSFASGFFSNAAYLHPSGEYKIIRGEQTVHLHPMSVYNEIVDKPKYVIFVEILNTTKAYMRHIMGVEVSWLLEAAPHYYTFATNLEMIENR